ncbi:methyltransferase domain-containing protein, partial [Candidatus Poribacteria bacterium]|nr:methyltransferase domain-containing protein [Candidatus Poribacteria bacterium]
IIPFYGAKNKRLFNIERRCMDSDGVVIRYLDAHLPDGHVFDIGAGSGFTASKLTTPTRIVVPLEPARGMIDSGKSLPWVQGIAQQLPFKSNSFAAAYATWAYFFPAVGYGDAGLAEVNRVVAEEGRILIVDNAGNDEFCGLFERDIASHPSWWRGRGFDCYMLQTAFRFDTLEEAEELLSFYWSHNGRAEHAIVRLEIEYKVAVYLGRSRK